ncbi:MAG TPA: hypothetical protein VI434_08655 [Candidatus Dormibacteraeota bacterium]
MPVSPAGKSFAAVDAGAPTLIPRPDCTVAALGHVRFTAAAVGVAVDAAVAGALVDAGDELPVDAEPQAASMRPAKEIKSRGMAETVLCIAQV